MVMIVMVVVMMMMTTTMVMVMMLPVQQPERHSGQQCTAPQPPQPERAALTQQQSEPQPQLQSLSKLYAVRLHAHVLPPVQHSQLEGIVTLWVMQECSHPPYHMRYAVVATSLRCCSDSEAI